MPFAALIGAELIEVTPELVRGRMEWAPERCTAGGLLHGGALMSLADGAGGALAFLNLPEGAVGTATIESKTNFLRGVREGAVTSISRPLHKGRTMIVIETELTRDDGALAAKVTQTQAFNYPRRLILAAGAGIGCRAMPRSCVIVERARAARSAADDQPARAAQHDDGRAVRGAPRSSCARSSATARVAPWS